jgi:hypothetical protein
MATQQIAKRTNNQMTVHNDLGNLFIGENRYEEIILVNSGSSIATFQKGTVMGRLLNANVVPFTSDASDGSNFPIGILANNYELPPGAAVDGSICISGDVAGEKVIFYKVTDNLNTQVDGRLLRDRIKSDTLGINLVFGTELTGFDN